MLSPTSLQVWRTRFPLLCFIFVFMLLPFINYYNYDSSPPKHVHPYLIFALISQCNSLAPKELCIIFEFTVF